MAKDTGGPAFPVIGAPGAQEDYPGMTLRDYFAAKVLPEAISHEREIRCSQISPGAFRYDAIAHAAYVIADAMLAEREK